MQKGKDRVEEAPSIRYVLREQPELAAVSQHGHLMPAPKKLVLQYRAKYIGVDGGMEWKDVPIVEESKQEEKK
jgi:hypothetical protein